VKSTGEPDTNLNADQAHLQAIRNAASVSVSHTVRTSQQPLEATLHHCLVVRTDL